MEITKESWDALYQGQLRDAERILDLQERLGAMAKQIEKLSWCLEKAYEWYIEPEYGSTVEAIEDAWEEYCGKVS